MESVYASAGIAEISAHDYMLAVCQTMPADPALGSLLAKVESAQSHNGSGSSPVLITRIHGDLYARHVHRSGERWWLLDWGESSRRELFLEILNPYIRRPASYSHESARFWHWLARGGEVTGDFGDSVALFSNWIRAWTGHSLSTQAIRFQILVYLLERVIEERSAESSTTDQGSARFTKPRVRPDVANADTIVSDTG